MLIIISIEDLTKSLKYQNDKIIVDIYPISAEYKTKNNINETRNQNIIIISSTKDMIQFLNSKNSKQCGIDCTFKIMPRSYSGYKLMTIYAAEDKNNNIKIAYFICLKYNGSNSLIKIFSLLKAIYNFHPIIITTDFDISQIKAIKNCELFDRKPYIICCLFHFSKNYYASLIMAKLMNIFYF